MGYTVAAASLGCAKNLVDTETMLGLLGQAGYEIIDDASQAQIILVNTCGFIGDAKEESIDTILSMGRYKQEGKCRVLIVAGCLAERYRDEVLQEMPEVDAVVGTGDFASICEVVERTLGGEAVALYGHADAVLPEGMPRLTATAPYTAYLKIADGCDNRCTYCVIPSLRGPYHSRRMEDVVFEAESLVRRGVRELILIAQDTTRYGIDLYQRPMLAALLEQLCRIEDLRWVRLHYCYPEAIGDDLLDVMASNPKVCRYLDIPIQHASDEVLKRMGRRTNRAQITALLHKIRSKMPGVTLRTSLIVGFPGETEQQFAELEAFVREARFDRLGVFAYSREEGTPAARLGGQIPERVKQQRRDRLMQVAQKISLEKNEEKVGSEIEVLCEGFDEESFLYFGRSRADSLDVDGLVYFGAAREVEPGEFVRVRVLCAQEYDLTGEMVEG